MQNFNEEIDECIRVLKTGGLILYPTDTVWGIGCDATNEAAVAKVFALKKRSDSKSLIVLLDSENKLMKYVSQMPDLAWDILEYSTKPLTMIYEHCQYIADNALAADGSVGIRVTKDAFCKDLIRKFNRPIISTSANISGENVAQNFSEISEEIKTGVDYVVKYRQHEMNKSQPSTIMQVKMNGEVKIIRK